MKSGFFKRIITILVFSGILLTVLITCEKPERVVQFTTLEAQTADVSYTTATLKGEITDAGSKPINDHGILVSTDANPRVGNATVKSLGSRSSKGVFSANVTDLTKNTTYYFRSYVTIEGVDTYAEKICSFTTKDAEAPTVTAGTISALTMTSASLNGEVTSDGGESAVTRGLCWGSEANPTISDCIDTTKNGSGTGVFTGSMTDLTPGTQYYARTYAINSKGTSYNSADIVFTTHNLPVVTTASVTDITETTATSGGEVSDTGGVNVTARGVCWSTTTGPTVDLTTKTSDGTGEGAFVSSVTGLTQGTSYYLRAYATNQYGTSYGSETSFTTSSSTDAPIAVTVAAGAVASTSALLQGTVNANGYSTTVSFEYGLTTSYGTELTADQSPVTGTTETAVNVGVTGLTASTTYHYRVKAVSTGGTTYGDDMEFTTASTLPTVSDYDGNTYDVITINTQDWIQENLKTTHYNNGEAIANITDDTEWEALTSGAYCWYDNDEGTYKNTYGALYNWYTTVDVRNVCPAGWHVPTDDEWTTLTDYLGGVSYAGGKLKETGTAYWTDPNSGATNETGFTALPGGQRRYDGPFNEIGDEGSWWTSTVYNSTSAWWRLMEYNNTQANHHANSNNFGFSVRCIKGELPLTKIGDATTIAATSATLNGQVNPNNASTTVTFEYGLTDSYGSEVTASESPVTGSTPASVSADISSLSESTTYHYRVKAVNSYGTTYSADMTFTTSSAQAPTTTTQSATSVTSTSATLNGTVNANDLSTTVTFEYGLTTTYGTEVTAAESPVTGTTATAVSYNLSSLTASTTYHYRVKAVSTGGTTYGDDMEFTTAAALPTVSDYDGNEYNIITIGTQDWIQENLKTTHYNNGDAIANITGNTEWSGLTTGAYCWYDNDEGTYKDTYGALYNWYTTVDIRNVCPVGWHVPTDAEWTTLSDYLGGESVAGGKLKEESLTHWESPNTGATNESGFTALPAGERESDGNNFSAIGYSNFMWSSTVWDGGYSWSRAIFHNASNLLREYYNNKYGYSIRCIKGELPLAQSEDATSMTATSATLNGQVNSNNASTTVTFEYGLTTAYGTEVTAAENPVTGTTPVSVSAGISSLSESTTYHYRVKAVNSYGTTYSADMTFTTLTPPTATTGSATSITGTSATLDGTVNANNLSTTVTFEYGLTDSYGSEVTANESPVTGSTNTAVTGDLSSLTASTTYHYRVKAVSAGGTTYGDDVEFTTINPATVVFSIIGSETSWSSDIDFTYTGTESNISAYKIDSRLFIQDEEFKIRRDHAWDITYAYNDLTILGEPSNFEESSTNIKVLSERTYEAIFEINWTTGAATLTMNNLTIFGIVGSETGWTNDVDFTFIETTSNVSTYYIESRLFVDGEQFVIRKDHDWTVSYKYGDLTILGETSNLTASGDNILVLCERIYEATLVVEWMTDVVTLTMNNLTPSVSTIDASAVTSQSVTTGGEVLDEGSSSVTAKGICWGTSSSPTISGSNTNDGSGSGEFTSSLTELTPNTTYYLRAYATNSEGTSYGNEVSFTTPAQVADVDGNTYNTVIIGTQTWMQENLKTTKYKNSNSIPLVTDNGTWAGLTTPAYCWYNNDKATYGDTYGALYNWYTVNTGNLCPTGWHVPTDAEWTTMENYLIANGYNYDGTTTDNLIAKALASTTLWTSSTTTGAVGNTDYPSKRNATGFTSIPGGYRGSNGPFYSIGSDDNWWSTTENETDNAWLRWLHYSRIDLARNYDYKPSGFYIRCVKD